MENEEIFKLITNVMCYFGWMNFSLAKLLKDRLEDDQGLKYIL